MNAQFKFAPALARHDLDGGHKRTNDARRFPAVAFIGSQGVLQFGHLPAIGFDGRRVQFHDLARFRQHGKLCGQAFLFRLDLKQSGFHAGGGDAIGNRVYDVVDLPFYGAKPLFDLLPFLPDLCRQALPLGVIFGQKLRDGIRGEQPLPDAVQNAAFKIGDANGPAIAAGSLFPVGRASKLVLALDRIGCAAASAFHKAGEHMPGASALVQPGAAVKLLSSLHRIP
nr:hypothetical protein [Sphingobium cloacae]